MSTRPSASLASPVGALHLAASPAGLTTVSFRPPAASAGGGEPDSQAIELLADAVRQLGEYFAGKRREFAVPLDWSVLSAPQERVLRILHGQVAFGDTVTYGWLARQAGLTADHAALPARAVGQIMGANPWPIIVPCHRVVAGDGLGGYSGGTGIEVKRWLLVFEGALPPTLDWAPAGPAASRGSPGWTPPAGTAVGVCAG